MKTDLIEIFQTIRAVIQPFELMGLSVHKNSDEQFELWSDKNVVIDSVDHHELHFCSLRVDQQHVVLTLMPHDWDEDLESIAQTELLDLQEGKTSFKIKALDEKLLGHISAALNAAHVIFKKNEWV